MKKIKIYQRKLYLSDEIIGFMEKRVTPFGTGAKVDCPKEYIGKRVYLIVCKD
jgi:putative transposon-encoded protein